jgi:hypothetical protein
MSRKRLLVEDAGMEKMRWRSVGVQWCRFQRLRTGIKWLPVLRAASRVSGLASENRCPGYSDKVGYPRETIPRPHFAREGSRGSFSLFIAAQAAAQL